MIRTLLGALSPEGPRGRLSTLIFHRVLPVPDPLFPEEVDAARFDDICRWIRQWFNVLPLDLAAKRLESGSSPARALTITFDDGYEDNFSVALPILRRHGLTATFFIATGFLDGGRMWNDTIVESIRRAKGDELDLTEASQGLLGRYPIATLAQRRSAIDAILPAVKYLSPSERLAQCREIERLCGAPLPMDLMMSSAQVRQLRESGMQVGAHTVWHPILARLTSDEVALELQSSKQRLEEVTGDSVDLFAYPNGRLGDDYTLESVEHVRKAGFRAAVTTNWGAADASTDIFQIPRFTPWDRNRWMFGARLVRNLGRLQ